MPGSTQEGCYYLAVPSHVLITAEHAAAIRRGERSITGVGDDDGDDFHDVFSLRKTRHHPRVYRRWYTSTLGKVPLKVIRELIKK